MITEPILTCTRHPQHYPETQKGSNRWPCPSVIVDVMPLVCLQIIQNILAGGFRLRFLHTSDVWWSRYLVESQWLFHRFVQTIVLYELEVSWFSHDSMHSQTDGKASVFQFQSTDLRGHQYAWYGPTNQSTGVAWYPHWRTSCHLYLKLVFMNSRWIVYTPDKQTHEYSPICIPGKH